MEKDSRQADNGSQGNLPVFVQQRSADQKTEPLSHISEHCAEDKRVSQSDKDRRVHLVIGWEPVHLNVHLKRTEQFRVFQLCGRLPERIVVLVLDKAVKIFVILDIMLEGFRILF